MRKTYYNPHMEKDDTWIAGLIFFTILIILFFVDNPFNEPLIKWGIYLLGIVIGGSIAGSIFTSSFIPPSLATNKWERKEEDERNLEFLAAATTNILMIGGIIGFLMIAIGGIISVVKKLI